MLQIYMSVKVKYCNAETKLIQPNKAHHQYTYCVSKHSVGYPQIGNNVFLMLKTNKPVCTEVLQ